MTSFRDAVRIDPHFAAAWEALGDALIASADSAAIAKDAIVAYERALRTRPSAVLLNNLAYAEILGGAPNDAMEHARAAAELLPDDLTVASTLAEALVARNDRTAAISAANTLVARFATESQAFRDAMSSAWRRDEKQMIATGAGEPLREEFFALLDRAAATRHAFGATALRPRGQVRVSRVKINYDPDTFTMRYAIDVAQVRVHDRITVRVFASGTDVAAAGVTRVSNGVALGTVAVDPGSYSVEVYVNGHRASMHMATFAR